MQKEKIVEKGVKCWSKIGVWGTETPRCERLEKVIHCRNCEVFTNAGRELLEREPPQDYVDDWTELLTRYDQSSLKKTRTVLAFRIGDELVAIPIGLVKEIVEMGRMHQIPHKDNKVIKGLVSIRGELKLCVSIGGLLGIKKGEFNYVNQHLPYSSEHLIVTVYGENEFVFPVSEVIGLRRVDPGALQNAPSTVSNALSSSITGIYEIDGRNFGMLDENKLYEGFIRNL